MKKLSAKFILTTLVIICFNNISLSAPINTYIDNVIPKQNEVSANRSENITIRFTQNMDASTLNNSNIKVFGMMTGLLQISIVYNPAARTMTINPVKDFKTGEEVSVTLTNGIKTSLSVSITQFVFSFTVKTIGGNGLFTKGDILEPYLYNAYPGDIDNDDDIDVVGIYEHVTKIFKNNGSGAFSLYSSIPIGTTLNLSDFDNDRDLDMLINNNDSIYFYRNDGLGNFALDTSLTGYAGQTGDLNGDGFLDVAYTASYKNYVLKNINGVFSKSDSNDLSPCNRGFASDMRINDFNNDGFLDIAELTDCYFGILGFLDSDRNLELYLNSSSSTFTHLNIYNDPYFGGPEGFATSQLGNFASLDYNNDGFVDFVTSSVRLTNGGYENFLPSYIPYFFLKPVKGDFNGDGSIDLAVTRGNTFVDFNPALNTLINDGAGHYTTLINYDIIFYGGSAADFDNDGDLDMIGFSDHARILWNDNCASVSAEIQGPAGLTPGTVSMYTNANPGTWELHNFSPANAFISGSSFNDTIFINSGTNYGSFLLGLMVPDSCGGKILTTKYVNISTCSISGPENTPLNSNLTYTVGYNPNARWVLRNYGGDAFIIGSNDNDTVVVNSGTIYAQYFELTYIDTNVTENCTVYVYLQEGPLPVELTSFTSNVNGMNVSLKWTTASEINNSGFDIERSNIIDHPEQHQTGWSKVGYLIGKGTIFTSSDYEFTDRNLTSGKYKYRLKQIDFNGNYEYYDLSGEVVIGVPEKYFLSQNYPNPFNPVTNLEFGISDLGFVSLKIFDMAGREITELIGKNMEAGYYKVNFDGSNLSSGIYFYRLQSVDFIETKKMMLLK
ncbi:MAG: FG-GAP-like repeat-containing protein [Ignavibacteria bacterium]